MPVKKSQSSNTGVQLQQLMQLMQEVETEQRTKKKWE